MRGGRIDQPGPRRERLDHQALPVDRHPDHPRPERGQQRAHRRISRLLHRDHIAWRDQHPADQVDRLLRAARHDDVVRHSPHRPADADEPRDLLAQPFVPAGLGVRRGWSGPQPQLGGDQPAPGLEREQPRVRHAHPEVVARRRCGPARPAPASATQPGRGRRADRPARASRRGAAAQCERRGLGHERPGADPTDGETLRRQPVVRRGDGVAGDLQAGGQDPGRRQPLARAGPGRRGSRRAGSR